MRENVLQKDTKIFICIAYHFIKKALIKRGWHENPDVDSPIFDLKVALNCGKILKSIKKPHQIVNHFSNQIAFTSKVGLTKNLKSLKYWQNDMVLDEFFPKCFNIDLEIIKRNDRKDEMYVEYLDFWSHFWKI